MNMFDILLSGKIVAHDTPTEELNVTQNGTYAEQGKAYNPVNVNVPTYGASDVGKVVTTDGQDYALTAQSSATYTSNNTYDTTLVNSVTVNVSGGGDARWQEIGYTSEPACVQNGINNAKSLAQNWTSSSKFQNDRVLVYAPYVTLSAGQCGNLFRYCSALQAFPKMFESYTTSTTYMFDGCYALEDASNLSGIASNLPTYMFNNCESLKIVPLFPINSVRTWSMFFGCKALESIPAFDLSSVKDAQSMFEGCVSLKSIPAFTLNTTQFSATSWFRGCTALETVPQLNLAGMTGYSGHSNMFQNCPSLSNDSLNNILATLTNSGVQGNKTLTIVGLSASQQATCATLSNWQAFLDAGWTA